MRTLRYLIEFIIIHFLFIIFKFIGYEKASNLGYKIGSTFGNYFKSKELINNNLKKAKVSDNDNLNEISKNVLGNYGRILAEYPFLKNFRENKLDKYLEIEGIENLKKLKVEKKQAVFISGHFNNFELMAMQIEKAGIDLCAIYRPLNNKFLNRTMEHIRKNFICREQISKGRPGTRKIIESLKSGFSVALMIDQRVREGSNIDFFGNPATTTTIPAQLITKYSCDLIPVYIERKKKFYFKMYISEPIKVDKNKSIDEITLYLNKVLEKMITKNVDQWIWTHDRWKS